MAREGKQWVRSTGVTCMSLGGREAVTLVLGHRALVSRQREVGGRV